MFQIIRRHEAEGIGVGVLAAEEPIRARIFSQADETGSFCDAHLSGIGCIESGGDFPDGEGLGVVKGTQKSVIDYDVFWK